MKVLSVFNTFTTSKINSLSTVVKGQGHGGAEIKILNDKKNIGKSTVNKKGEYLVKISKQKKNTVLRIEMKKQGFQSSYKNVKVH
ncbi:Ig-like domain-containing protein [Exiguobacterium antarcticum]|uniref:Ig-like domain-containing protein n=1 Tax=Exiguobacterium antarcticum TaxID=132920 RepID=UPI0006841E8B